MKFIHHISGEDLTVSRSSEAGGTSVTKVQSTLDKDAAELERQRGNEMFKVRLRWVEIIDTLLHL